MIHPWSDQEHKYSCICVRKITINSIKHQSNMACEISVSSEAHSGEGFRECLGT